MLVKNVFICYRRDDAEGYAGRLYDRLNARFPGRIFMDVTGISPGADFTRVIQEKVGACSALLAIIGKQWLTMADEASHRRLFREDDYVRHEIATALTRNIAVIPVLVRDATMPSAQALPPDLAALSFRNAIEISDTDFDHDVARLIEGLEFVFGERRPVAPPRVKSNRNSCLIISVIAALLAGVGILLLIIMTIAANQAGNTGGSPEAPDSQTPNQDPAQNSAPVAVDFNPVGSWSIQIENGAMSRIDLHEDHTYKSPNERGSWQYSPADRALVLSGVIYDPNTEATQQYNAQITIEGRDGNQFVGSMYAAGTVHRVWLTRL